MSHKKQSHFVVPVKYYLGTFISLLILTFITVWVAQFDFGALNIYIAMFIALVKATLVITFFMGLKWDNGFNRIIVASTLIFFGIFIALTMADITTRGHLDPIEAGVHDINSPVKLIQHGQSSHSKKTRH